MAKSSTNDKPTKYEPRFTNYTTLSANRAEIYLASHQEVPYRKPSPIRKEMSKRDLNKFCRFHGDYGHDTNECNHLKDEIEFLLRSGKLKKYRAEKTQGEGSNNNPGFKRQRYPPLQPEPVDFTLDTICGGPHLAGNSQTFAMSGFCSRTSIPEKSGPTNHSMPMPLKSKPMKANTDASSLAARYERSCYESPEY